MRIAAGLLVCLLARAVSADPFVPPPPLPTHDLYNLDAQGRLVIERYRRVGNRTLWVAGTTLFVIATVAGSAAVGLDPGAGRHVEKAGIALVPIIGPLINCGMEGDPNRQIAWVPASVIQGAALALIVIGQVAGSKQIERFPLQLGAAPTVGGGAFSASGRF